MCGVTTNYDRNEGRKRDYLDVWTGSFLSEWIGSGVSLPRRDGYMLTMRNGDRVRVSCPVPRDERNWQAVDEAISAAVREYETGR